MIIIDRNKTEKLLVKLDEVGVNFTHVFRAEGTAKSDVLEMLGIGHPEKSVVLCTLTKDTVVKVKDVLTTDFDSANIDGIRKINVIDWLLGKE